MLKEIPAHLKHPCFFCLKREGKFAWGKGAKRPPPIPPGTVIACCGRCRCRPLNILMDHVLDHIVNLRVGDKLRAIAETN